MTQKTVAKAAVLARPPDEARDVRDLQPVLITGVLGVLDHADLRLQRGEGIRRNPGPGPGQLRDQRGLAGVGKADQADVGDALQDELVRAALARLTRIGVARGAVGR